MCDDFLQQWAELKAAAPYDQNRIIASIVTEYLTTGWLARQIKLTAVKTTGVAKRFTVTLSEKLTEATKPAAVAKTAEGVGLRVAGDAATFAEKAKQAACKMENEAAKVGVETGKVAAKAEEAAAKQVGLSEKPKSGNIALGKDGFPLDERLLSEEQRAIRAANKARGEAIRKNGLIFEEQCQKKLGGTGSFKMGGREFDGCYQINKWYEAKAGEYWEKLSLSKKFEKFRSDMGHRLRIAKAHGATYELFSNTPIPQFVKEWLTEHSIKFTEWL
jgi:hypothetical protein